MTRWSLAFIVAAVAAASGTGVLRRVAIATGFVDHPGRAKSHTHDIPYLGGIAIAGATIVAWLVEPALGTRIAVVALAAVGVALVGLVDDDRGLQPGIRLVAETTAAAAVVATGVRAEPTHIVVLDVVITLVWIVGVTNALNLLDNMDGLAAGVVLAAASGAFALAAIGGQQAIATAAAGLTGACFGFLVHNWRPASIFMGDAGALFLGFVLSIVVLELRPILPLPDSLAVPLLFLALPMLDTTVVTVARFRHGRRIAHGGTDHLSHRLVALGASPVVAVSILIVVQAGLSTLAVLTGRAIASVPVASALAAIILGVLALVTGRGQVYDTAAIRLQMRRPSTRRRAALDGELPTAAATAVPVRFPPEPRA